MGVKSKQSIDSRKDPFSKKNLDIFKGMDFTPTPNAKKLMDELQWKVFCKTDIEQRENLVRNIFKL